MARSCSGKHHVLVRAEYLVEAAAGEDSWNAAARSGTSVSSAKGSIHGAEWPVSPAGLPHCWPASKIRGMATVEECLEHADELTQRVVNAWAGNADAGHGADITDEYNALFERANVYQIAKRSADNRRKSNISVNKRLPQKQRRGKRSRKRTRAFTIITRRPETRPVVESGHGKIQTARPRS